MRMKKTILYRILILMLCLLMGMPALAEPAVSKIRDDGLLRVYLRSLSDPENLTLTRDGASSRIRRSYSPTAATQSI